MQKLVTKYAGNYSIWLVINGMSYGYFWFVDNLKQSSVEWKPWKFQLACWMKGFEGIIIII